MDIVMSYPLQGIPTSVEDLDNAPIRCAAPLRRGRDNWLPCGRCVLCRDRAAAILAHRIDLEAEQHLDVAFVTLTYSPQFLPSDGSVNLDDPTLWLKRLRKALKDQKLRYYYLAEYGRGSYRPHYHVVLFGYPSCIGPEKQTWYGSDGIKTVCCEHCKLLEVSWQMGRVHSIAFKTGGSHYLAGYVAKAARGMGPPVGLRPEFARWSRRPGLGSGAVAPIARAVSGEESDDVPVALRYGHRTRPLGTFLRRKLRDQLGIAAGASSAGLDACSRRQAEASREAERLGTNAPEMGRKVAARRLAKSFKR